MRFLAAGALALVMSFTIHAGQVADVKGDVSGSVKTAEGAALPGASVEAVSETGGKSYVTWTDSTGKFNFSGLPAGKYRVQANQLGFLQVALEISVPDEASKTISIVMRVATLAELSAPPGATAEKPKTASRAGGPESAAKPPTAGQPRRGNGGQAVPPGVANALHENLGGFQQTDLSGEQGAETTGAAAGSEQTAAAGNEAPQMSAAGAGAASDSFLLQGTVGQGATTGNTFGPGGPGGPGGPAGEGAAGLVPSLAGGPGGPGGFGGGAGGGGVRFGGGPGGGQFGGPGGGGRGGGGGGGRGGRLARQMVNRVRWSFYDQYQNSAFDARPFSITGVESPKLSHYDERLGGNIGGPLKIPHIYNGSDRTFVFLNYEHETQKTPIDEFSTVPTLAERSGDFCGTAITLFDPASNGFAPTTRQPLGNGCQIPALNSAAVGLLAYIPLPNVASAPIGPDGLPVQNFHLQTTTPLNSDRVNFHLLHTINAKFNLNAGYNFSSQRSDSVGNFPEILGTSSTRSQSVTLGLAHNWTQHLVENTTLNWSRNRIQVLSDNSFVNNVAGDLGITGVSTTPIDYGIPQVVLTDFSGFNDPNPALTRNQTLRLGDSLNWVHKNHTLIFGGELRRIQLNLDSNPIARGEFTFTGFMTSQLDPATGQALPGTGNDFADFLLGYPQNTQSRFGNPNMYLRTWTFIGYAQDDWRVNKHFTFQYGVRYEAVTPPVELYNNISNLYVDPAITEAVVVTPTDKGSFANIYPRALIHGDYGNWSPRVGFAWLPTWVKPKTVVRGGYSIFYNESVYTKLAQQYLAYQPPSSVSQYRNTSQALPLTLQNGFPGQGSTTNQVSNTAAVNPDYKDGYAQIWTLGTETSFSQNWILDLTYTGTKGTDLDLLRAPNRAPLGTPPSETDELRKIPYADGFTYDQSGADSLYNALQVRLVHRFTKGFTLSGIYTFSKSLDDASTIGGASAVVVQNDSDFKAEWGLSPFDVRHQVRVFSVYELPFGEHHRYGNKAWEEHAFGNWRLMNNITWQTGTPVTAYVGGSASDNGTGANFSLRADQLGNPNTGICGGSALNFFNTTAFATPPATSYGDERRGAIEGPCSFSWNISLAKSFRFGPENRHRVEFHWDVSNLTNSVNFSGVNATLGSSLFGHVTSAASMRTMSAMLRFNF